MQNINPLTKNPRDNLYKILFVVFVGFVIWGFYYATLKIDYVWRWYRVPSYFIYTENVKIKSEIEGTIKSLNIKGENALINVEGSTETASYKVKASDIIVYQGDYVFPGQVIASYERTRAGILLEGLWITLKASIFSTIAGIIIGFFAGIARISSNSAFKWAAITYIEIVRGSPLLVQIFIWYFIIGTMINGLLSSAGLSAIPPLWYGIASLATFAGAYVAEIVRAGIESIHFGQFEASRSLGMTYSQSMRYVILPQALRRILPPLAGQFITLIKDSCLLGIIAIRELTKATREIIATSLQPFELWLICAVLYLLLTFSLSMFVQYLERRYKVK